MQKPDIIKMAPRISERSADWLAASFGTRNAGAEYVLDSFPQLYRLTLDRLKGEFSRGELMLMIDVNNGLILTPGLAGQHLAIQVGDGIALDRLDAKWEIDGHTLNNKISNLQYFERACLEIWARAFWGNRDKTDLEQYVKGMAKE